MTAPDEPFPRPRALRDRLSRRPRLSPNQGPQLALPEPRTAPDDEAWFTYLAADQKIVWSEALTGLLGRPPASNELTQQILARHVHVDDHAKAFGAITRAWTAREPVRTTVRLMRDDGGWFDVDCRLEPIVGPDGAMAGLRRALRDASARERARREVARLSRRGETVQASIVERDPVTGLMTRARFADEVDRAQRRGGGAVLVIRVEPARAQDVGVDRHADLVQRAARVLEGLARPDDLLGQAGP